tara:strand:+ start:3108 stop:3929 length:822 start_codon:yes stop_codon:yes gene_type:complete
MSRLFTFGCSFTSYAWPTWANIIAYDKGNTFYNYGDSGIGNYGIANRVLEADLKHNFTKDDEIYILWSGWSREDRIKNDRWNTAGTVLNPHNEVYDRTFLKKYWDINNDIVTSSHAIITTNRIFKNNIKWQGTAMPFYNTDEPQDTLELSDFTKQLVSLYKKQIPDMIYTKLDKPLEEQLAFNRLRDNHPDVHNHLEFVKLIYNNTNQTLNQKTIDYFNTIQNYLETIIAESNSTTLDHFIKLLPQFIRKFEDMSLLMMTEPLNKNLPDIHDI